MGHPCKFWEKEIAHKYYWSLTISVVAVICGVYIIYLHRR